MIMFKSEWVKKYGKKYISADGENCNCPKTYCDVCPFSYHNSDEIERLK